MDSKSKSTVQKGKEIQIKFAAQLNQNRIKNLNPPSNSLSQKELDLISLTMSSFVRFSLRSPHTRAQPTQLLQLVTHQHHTSKEIATNSARSPFVTAQNSVWAGFRKKPLRSTQRLYLATLTAMLKSSFSNTWSSKREAVRHSHGLL